jgi:cytochrome c
MPAWQEPNGPLTAQDVEDLTAFVLTLSGGRPDEFPTPELKPITPIPTLADVEGDPTLGSVVFAQNCAMCHGDQGQGRAGADLSRAFSSIRPDLTVRNTVVTGIAGTAMPAWAMANGGPLTDDEIDNVTAFVLTLPQETTSEPQPGTTPTTTTPAQPGFYLPVWAVVVLVAVLILLAVAVIFFARAR